MPAKCVYSYEQVLNIALQDACFSALEKIWDDSGSELIAEGSRLLALLKVK